MVEVSRQWSLHWHQFGDETGSVAPLAIGLASVLLASTFTFVNAGSVLLFQQRENQQAEALALAVDQALTADELAGAIADSAALDQAASSFAAEAGISNYEVLTPDGLTVAAKVCAVFNAPIQVPLLGPLAPHMVCATAKARRL